LVAIIGAPVIAFVSSPSQARSDETLTHATLADPAHLKLDLRSDLGQQASAPATSMTDELAIPSIGELDFKLDFALGMVVDAQHGVPAAGEAATAPAAASDSAELAKKLANPISSLISVPFQLNYDEGFGPSDAGKWTLNIQPVIPFSLNEDWNIISRTILPVVYQESLATGIDSEFGLGDTLQSLFFSPKDPVHGWIIGAGPVFLLPTATDTLLGSENFGIGPTIVALQQKKGWTYGVLANHIYLGHLRR
jgi:hypothetical protein